MLSKTYHAIGLFCFIFSFFLTGCGTKGATPPEPSIYGNSSITRMPVARYVAQHQAVINKLRDNGVQFIQTGDDLMLVLSSDQVFVAKTPILNTSSYSALNGIASLLKDHEKFSVSVAGYTDSMGWQQRNIALSRQQAAAVADYLWRQGIDTRLMYTVGYGAKETIASNSTSSGRAMNRRIEITLRWVTDIKQG